MEKLAAIVLAAGRGTRMLSQRPKVLHDLLGEPLLFYPLSTLLQSRISRIEVVVGADQVGDQVAAGFTSWPGLHWSRQQKARGTADAVAAALPALEDFSGTVLILCGDVPLLRTSTLEKFYHRHCELGADLTVLTAELEDGGAYGRVLVDNHGAPTAIVEARDASADELAVRRVNSGTYLVDIELLRQALGAIDCRNAQGEFYLTDMVALARAAGRVCAHYDLSDAREMAGINNRVDLVRLEAHMAERINFDWLERGVTIRQPATVRIGPRVEIAEDVEIDPGAALMGESRIGAGSRIGTGAQLSDAVIDARVEIKPYTVIENSRIGAEAQLGPFARIRPGTELAAGVKIGNFVETKKALFGEGAKASHLAYIGDAEIGAGSNLGAGTITCNYDGINKFPTVIGRRVFVGSDTQLVAPVKIGDDALIGAGSTITRDVADNALVTTRVRQRELSGRGMASRKASSKEK